MRVVWITPGFAADETDSTCIPPLQLLARELRAREADLHIIALDYPFRRQPYTWQGIPVYPCDGRNRNYFGRLHRADKHFKKIQPVDVVHSFWLGPAWMLGKWLKFRYGTPQLTTLMGQDVLASNRYLYFLGKKEIPNLIAVSDFQAKVLCRQIGDAQSPLVIPWGIDPPSANFSDRPRAIDILGVGSLIPLKDWEKWLGVVAKVKKNKPDLRAELIGQGPLFEPLKRLSENLGLRDTVRFTGSIPREMVLKKMQEAKVLLHTSHFESFGFVLAEAAGAGCRVVSTPVGIGQGFWEPEDLAREVWVNLRVVAPSPGFYRNMATCAGDYLEAYAAIRHNTQRKGQPA